MNLVEGVDYIFDRYAYLGIEPSASKQEVRTAIRNLRASVHEAKLQGLNPKLQNNAEEINHQAGRCAAMLLSEEMRPLYDEKLAWFKEHKPGLVSTTGLPIVDLMGERVDLDSILEGAADNLGEIEKRAKTMTGYSPAFVSGIALQFALTPSDEVKSLYRMALSKELEFLSVMEHQAWMAAGVTTKETSKGEGLYADEYMERVEAAVEHTRDIRIADAVTNRRGAMAIGMAQPPLLLGFNGSAALPKGKAVAQEISDDVAQQILDKARENFESAAARIRGYAKRKQEVLGKLVELSDYHVLHQPDPVQDGDHRIYFLQPGEDETDEPRVSIVFNFHIASGAGSMNGAEIDEERTPLSTLKAQTHTLPSVAVIHNPSLDSVYLEPAHAVNVLRRIIAKPDTPAAT